MSQEPDTVDNAPNNVKQTEKTVPGTEERSGDDVLLDIRQVAGYTIRPLSFGKLAVIMPLVAQVGEKFKDRLPAFEDLTPQAISIAIMLNIESLIPIIAAYVDEPVEKIRELPAQQGVELAFAIYVANAKTFMDFFVIGSQVAPR